MVFSRLSAKVHHFLRCYLQHLAQLKQHVKRNADVAQLDRADMASIHVHQFRKLHLRQALALAMIYYVQSELLV